MANIITLSNGDQYATRLEVWDDLHSELPGRYRLFWARPDGTDGTPAVGYCSPGGSYRTIKMAIADGVRRFGEVAIRRR
jgi:hypothetical protein